MDQGSAVESESITRAYRTLDGGKAEMHEVQPVYEACPESQQVGLTVSVDNGDGTWTWVAVEILGPFVLGVAKKSNPCTAAEAHEFFSNCRKMVK